MSSFSLSYSPLHPEHPSFGQAALMPWDTESFGFPVAMLAMGDMTQPLPEVQAVREALLHWLGQHHAELIACAVPADAFAAMSWLQAGGFVFVDLALTCFARRITVSPLPRVTLRSAAPEDLPTLEAIATRAFRFGRYHADPRFPRELADARFATWVRNACLRPDPAERLYVSGPHGCPSGFFHAKVENASADLRLAAADPDQNAGMLGPALFAAALTELRTLGARTARARISAGNTSVLNLYSSLGFTFSRPEAIFHFHAPGAKHLLPLG